MPVVTAPDQQPTLDPVEGTVNRVKHLKPAMYGRAKPDLLRKADPARLKQLGPEPALIRNP